MVSDAAYRPTPQPKKSTGRKAARPSQRTQVVRHVEEPSRSAASQGTVRQAQHTVPLASPEGEVIYEGEIYEGAIVDGSCDAMGSCGCDATGCDGIGSCGPSCGCKMCGELAGTRAWRPALTLSLPQDGWISIEGMTLWQSEMNLPSLVTTSPQGTARDQAGVLTRPGTRTLFGAGGVLGGTLDGARLRFGFWLDRCHSWGLGAELMEFDRQNLRYQAASTGDPILVRPFFNVLNGLEAGNIIAFPGDHAGTVTIDVDSRLVGGGFHVRRLLACNEGCRRTLFSSCNEPYCTRSEFRVGYRYMELDEGVSIREDIILPNNQGAFDITDRFRTLNQFNGFEFAWTHRHVRGYWSLEGMVRLAIGNNRQRVQVAGSSLITDGTDPPEQFDAGFLALSSNSGTFEQNKFSVLPELNLTLGYQVTDHLKATFGYTGVYWSNVVRPGEHIPTQINPDLLPPVNNTIPSDPRPLFAFKPTDYWAQGITYGLEYRW